MKIYQKFMRTLGIDKVKVSLLQRTLEWDKIFQLFIQCSRAFTHLMDGCLLEIASLLQLQLLLFHYLPC